MRPRNQTTGIEDNENSRSGGGEGMRPRNQTTGIENYLRTTRKIADHVGSTMSKEMWSLAHELEEFEFPDPPEPEEAEEKPVPIIEIEKFRMLFKMKHDRAEAGNKIEGLSKFREWQESNDLRDVIEEGMSSIIARVGTQGKCCGYYKMMGGYGNEYSRRERHDNELCLEDS